MCVPDTLSQHCLTCSKLRRPHQVLQAAFFSKRLFVFRRIINTSEPQNTFAKWFMKTDGISLARVSPTRTRCSQAQPSSAATLNCTEKSLHLQPRTSGVLVSEAATVKRTKYCQKETCCLQGAGRGWEGVNCDLV